MSSYYLMFTFVIGRFRVPRTTLKQGGLGLLKLFYKNLSFLLNFHATLCRHVTIGIRVMLRHDKSKIEAFREAIEGIPHYVGNS
jgi:hypothetical protein